MEQPISIWTSTKNGLALNDIREIGNITTVEVALSLPKETRVYFLIKENPVFIKHTTFNIIQSLVNSLNFVPKLQMEQMTEIVDDLILCCPDWSVHDFVLCFKNGKNGKYCQFFAVINSDKVFEMVLGYEQERSEAREQEVGKTKKDHLKELGNAEVVIDILKQIVSEDSKKEETLTTYESENPVVEYLTKLAKTPLKLIAHIGGEVLLGNIKPVKLYGIDENLVTRIQEYFMPYSDRYNRREIDYQGIISEWSEKDQCYNLRDEILEICEMITEIFEI